MYNKKVMYAADGWILPSDTRLAHSMGKEARQNAKTTRSAANDAINAYNADPTAENLATMNEARKAQRRAGFEAVAKTAANTIVDPFLWVGDVMTAPLRASVELGRGIAKNVGRNIANPDN